MAEPSVQELIQSSPGIREAIAFYQLDQAIKSEALSKATQPIMFRLIRDDLQVQGLMPKFRLLNDVQMVYDLSRGLRDDVTARGRPLLIQSYQTVAQVGGTATGTGYTVPPGRIARIDLIEVQIDLTAGSESYLWVDARIRLTPSGLPIRRVAGRKLAPSNVWEDDDLNGILPFKGPLYLNQLDLVDAQAVQADLNPALTPWSAIFTFYGIEIDVGYGFEDFPS